MSRRRQIIRSLKNKESREALVEANLETGISFQLRANRIRRGWSQGKLAKLAGKKQPYIAKMEGPSASLPNIRTLLDYASAFDCALVVRFVPFSELVTWVDGLGSRDLSVPSFDEDLLLSEPIEICAPPSGTGFMLGGFDSPPPTEPHFISAIDHASGYVSSVGPGKQASSPTRVARQATVNNIEAN